MPAVTPGGDFYEQLLGEYDQMMDWESRLMRETPFYQKIFADYQVKSLLDTGCGTGRHCFHFANLGIDTVVGTDISGSMIELAQARAMASGSEIAFERAAFTDVADKISGAFDLVCCLGNSISHLKTYDELELALRNFRRLTTVKGVILIQLLNWDLRLARQERFFPPRSHVTPAGEKLFFRFFDFHEELVTMNLLIFQQCTAPLRNWTYRTVSTTLRPWRRDLIRMALDDVGLSVLQEYGGTDLSPYQPLESSDYIVIAHKG
ncbi:MAG: class I SAM-dependent methyltransferase [bacterium]|nr:class I SAM-dependent methyltransferase [bacterium]